MGASRGTPIRWSSVLVLLGFLWSPTVAGSQEREVAGIVTEVHLGGGQVEVRSAGSELWRTATPLRTLRSGDTVSATGDGWVVLVLSGGRGLVRVDEATSPFVVAAFPAARSQLDKGLLILEASFSFLSTTSRDLPHAILGTRGGMKPPAILTPRNGPVLPGALVFEWRGSPSSRYALRIVAPDHLVLERANLAATRFEYPKDAPPLAAGVRYRFQLLRAWQPPQDVWFEVVDPRTAREIRDHLLDLEEALGPTAPAATRATLRAAFLAHNGLLHDARLEIVEELARQPDEPSLHCLLGDLYARQGLPEEAMESFAEARSVTEGPASAR